MRPSKKAWIENAGLVVYRYHDRIHRLQPDLVTEGLIQELEWQPYVEERLPEASIVRIPTVTLQELIAALKRKLRLPYVRFVGELTASCSRAGVTVGYRGGSTVVVPLFGRRDLDVVIAGEGPE